MILKDCNYLGSIYGIMCTGKRKKLFIEMHADGKKDKSGWHFNQPDIG